MNLGATALREQGHSLGDIARAGGGVSRQAAAKWRDGTSIPTPKAREGLRREFGIGLDAWDSEPVSLESSPPPAGDEPSLESMLDGADGVRLVIRRHLARIEELRRDAVKRRSVEDAAAALELERRAIVEFGAAIVEEGIVSSPKWQQIRKAIARALASFPEAARAVAEELGRIP